MKKTTIKKPEAIKWHHFSRRGDAIFLSLKKEIRISVLSVATLAVACPDSSAAIMAMSQRPTMDEQTNSAGASSSGGEDELLDLTALQHGDLLFCVASPARDGIAQAIVSVTEGIDLQRVSHVAIVCKESSGTYALEASDKHGVWLHPIQSFFEHCIGAGMSWAMYFSFVITREYLAISAGRTMCCSGRTDCLLLL